MKACYGRRQQAHDYLYYNLFFDMHRFQILPECTERRDKTFTGQTHARVHAGTLHCTSEHLRHTMSLDSGVSPFPPARFGPEANQLP